ncbi:MAG: hypothetical protein ACR2MN_08490, partial [Acidimicrobiales bacterium]
MIRRRAPLPVAELREWGVDPGYHDASGAWRHAPAETTAAILDEMGATMEAGPDAGGGQADPIEPS